VNIRILAATNRNLKTQIHAGKFRKDLYYRLNFLSISISPLRERNEDIMPLAVHFLKKLRPEKKYIINKEAEEKLLEYSWPGNVRELQSVILKSTFSTNTQIISPADIIFE
jgi:transcriptional regulator with PAS, ATPase and Fis domain